MSHVQALPLEASVASAAGHEGVSQDLTAYFAPPSFLQNLDTGDAAVVAVGIAAVGRAIYAHSHLIVKNILGRCR